MDVINERIFLDSKDLINIFNRSLPITPDELGRIFRANSHELILPFSLISELIPADRNPIVVARRFVKIEEDIPHRFIQMAELPDRELRHTATFVVNGSPVSPYDPFVATFTELWGEDFDPIFLMDLQRTIEKRKMSFQLNEAVLNTPEIFCWSETESAAVLEVLLSEQASFRTDRQTEYFEYSLKHSLLSSGTVLRENELAKLASLLRQSPKLAPGWRLHHEAFYQLVRDRAYKPTISDAWDLTHIAMVPYVDALTLDRQKVDLVRRTTHGLQRDDPSIDYTRRTFSTVKGLLQSIGA